MRFYVIILYFLGIKFFINSVVSVNVVVVCCAHRDVLSVFLFNRSSPRSFYYCTSAEL